MSQEIWHSSTSTLCRLDKKLRWQKLEHCLPTAVSLPRRSATRGFDLPLSQLNPLPSEANERDEAEDEDDKEDVLEYDSSSSDGDSNRKIGR